MADDGYPVRRSQWSQLWADHGNANRPPSRGAVAGWLWATARGDGTHACASVPWLASVSGVSQRTVKRVVVALRAELWLALRERGHYRGPNRPPTANVYDLTAPGELVDNSESTGHLDGTLADDANGPKSAANGPPRVARPCSSTNYPARGRARPPAARRDAHQTRNGAAICHTCGNRLDSPYHRRVCSKTEAP